MFCTSFIFFIVHTGIAAFNLSFHSDGYGGNAVFIFIYAVWYLYDLVLVFDILIDLRTAIDKHKGGMTVALFSQHLVYAVLYPFGEFLSYLVSFLVI